MVRVKIMKLQILLLNIVYKMAHYARQVRSGHGHYNTIESIPPYSLWAEADNKEYSEESNNHGPISKKLLIGQAERIVWPLSRWKKIERIFPSAGKAWWP